jgi:hypothetical protein
MQRCLEVHDDDRTFRNEVAPVTATAAVGEIANRDLLVDGEALKVRDLIKARPVSSSVLTISDR